MKLKKLVIAASMLSCVATIPAAFAYGELTVAVKTGEEDLIRTLIRQNADINVVERDGSTPLHWAVYHEQPGIVKSLIDAGADVGATNREGITPLSLAVQNGDAVTTRILLDAGASVHQTLANGETPLMMAARTGDLETIQLLLDRGADINATERLRGTTALMWAAAYKNAPAAKLLLDNGANLAMNSATTAPGRGPYLAPSARSRIREFYLNTGQGGASLLDVLGEFVDDDDPIPSAGDISREELVMRLPRELVQEFNEEEQRRLGGTVRPPQRKQWGGLTAMHFAVREGDLDTVKVLVEAGADVNQVSEYGWTPLLTATQNRYYQMGKYLLEQGADPNIANEGGWNPLYIATDNRNIEGGDYPTRKPDMDHLDYIKLLLEAGADPNLRMASSTETRTIFTHQWLREEGATPFVRAAQSSDLALMRLLLEYGADPKIATDHNVTALHVAAGIGWVEGVTYEWSEQANRETIQLLLDLGLDPNARDTEDGRYPLMGAAHKGRNYAVEMLVEAGARLDARDIGSRDTLHTLAGVTWQAIDYADGLVRVGVQSAETQPETAQLLRRLMTERGLEVPPEGRTLDSICIVDICR
jgi:uncharacterized protein